MVDIGEMGPYHWSRWRRKASVDGWAEPHRGGSGTIWRGGGSARGSYWREGKGKMIQAECKGEASYGR